jgi:hypothetical protein
MHAAPLARPRVERSLRCRVRAFLQPESGALHDVAGPRTYLYVMPQWLCNGR